MNRRILRVRVFLKLRVGRNAVALGFLDFDAGMLYDLLDPASHRSLLPVTLGPLFGAHHRVAVFDGGSDGGSDGSG